MMPSPSVKPLSVLDLALVGDGQTSADALAATTVLARRCEEAGYHRFWVAEHHNMPAVASTAPPVLIAQVAASTSTIRVGSGGVMLPNHSPLVVAEQFALLEALHPGRIDLGIGRAPGSDQWTAAALRRSSGTLGAEEFPQHLTDVMGLLGDPRLAHGIASRLKATPVAVSSPQIHLLGSSTFSAQLAGALGIPYAFAHHFSGNDTEAAINLYRDSFQPSPTLEHPYVIVTAGVMVAETDEEAWYQAGPSRLMMLSLRSGQLRPLDTPEAAAAHPDLERALALPSSHVVGTPDRAVKELTALVESTGADELMISTSTHGVEERVRSYELLARAWPATDESQGSRRRGMARE